MTTVFQESFTVATDGRGTIDVTALVTPIVTASGVVTGTCHVFAHHTSASLMLCENADPAVRVDLETFMRRIAPDDDPDYIHTAEGPDDMPAHVRSILSGSELTVPVTQGKCALGTWQGVYLWEHRTAAHTRRITVTVTGAA